MFLYKRFQQAEEALASYAYPAPFPGHLKQYFQKHREMGSRDRRELREVLYAYLRIGRIMAGESRLERIAAAYSLFNPGTLEDESLRSELAAASWPEKLNIAGKQGLLKENAGLYPAAEYISPQIDKEPFILSHLQQRRTWINIRKKYTQEVQKELMEHGIAFRQEGENTLSLAPDVALAGLQSYKHGYFWVQDYASQQSCRFFSPGPGETWWDACAGAGGKSLALREARPDVTLYASDIRKSVLENLQTRHKTIFGTPVKTAVADLSQPLQEKLPQFDGIIADMPCTGSGTWARNPEHLPFFTPGCIPDFAARQLQLLKNIWPKLKKGKPLVYITCSVFRAENESVIEALGRDHTFAAEHTGYIEGHRTGGENLFICRMIKN